MKLASRVIDNLTSLLQNNTKPGNKKKKKKLYIEYVISSHNLFKL